MNEKKLFAVIGDPVAHSLSPVMHNAAFRAAGKNAEYMAVRVQADDLGAFMADARKHLTGFNITIPHKQNILPLADVLSESARIGGSVNTIQLRDGGKTAYGDTTDGRGFERAVRESFALDLAGGSFCFIGCGGVARALVFHCAAAGAKKLTVINRTADKAARLLAEVQARFPAISVRSCALTDTGAAEEFLADADLAVQCTAVGLKDGDPAVVDPGLFPAKIRYFDTIYKPTALLRALEARGTACANGLGMLLHQGACSYELWFGETPPVEAMRKALLAAVTPS